MSQIKNQKNITPSDGTDSVSDLDLSQKDIYNDSNAPVPEDGMIFLKMSGDGLEAFLTVTDPKDGGQPIDMEDIQKELEINNIRYGVDFDEIESIIEKERYNEKICIAKGTPAVEGENGTIEYFFDPTSSLIPKKTEYGQVNYKDLGLVKNILQETPIFKIIPAIEGTDGTDVYGAPIKYIPVTEAKYVLGNGTYLDELTNEVKTAVDGNLSWENDRFVVFEELVIKESVGVSTGNIDFIGNILIKGEVKENFSVKSRKNITISGTVTQAEIIADGDVTLAMGCINSRIVAKGNIKIAFCEGSKIEAEGDVMSQSFIGCDVFCGGKLTALTGKGVIVGGNCTAIEAISANVIGSETYTKTHIKLGNGAVLTEEKIMQEAKIKTLEEQTVKLMQIVELLQSHKKATGQLSPERETMLTTAIRSRYTNQREVKQRSNRIKEIDILLSQTQELYVIAKREIWPGVSVRINSDIIKSEQHLSKIMVGKNNEGYLAFLPCTR